MTVYRFHHPIEVRYGDLDPQGHVNNARYLTYLEQARISYIHHLGLWPGGSFLSLGIILADIQITFHKPILFGDQIRVGVATTRLGNKSFTAEHQIEDHRGEVIYASSKSVLVTYDYKTGQTISIPPEWRKIVTEFENL